VFVSSVKSESLALGEVMTMTPVSNDPRLLWCVCGERLVARMAVCVLATVMFHDGRRECLYRFLVGFPLINWPISS
jgi:hypothetical protein